jgi:hypothetical protein
MNHLQLNQAALPDLSANQISRLPKDQLAQFSHAVQELHEWTIQMRGRINRGLEQRYDEQIRQANSFGEEESARFRIDDGDLQIDVSQPKEIVWNQEHLTQIADRMVAAGDRVQDFMEVHLSVSEHDYAKWQLFQPLGAASVLLAHHASHRHLQNARDGPSPPVWAQCQDVA